MKIELQFPIAGIKGLASTREASWMLCHDALAAHAWQAAIEQVRSPRLGPWLARNGAATICDEIETRAAELLASYLDEGK
jgi:hypothetical protein